MPPSTSTSSGPVLRVERLRKSFAADQGSSVEALKGISFELDHRQVTGLVGPDGAGKTTLL
ncbi:MAG: ATP-binding cassette domain-containing protein, partial [Tepidisphaeraceae bacterium]